MKKHYFSPEMTFVVLDRSIDIVCASGDGNLSVTNTGYSSGSGFSQGSGARNRGPWDDEE